MVEVNILPTFLVAHKWKPEEEISVIKEAIGLLTALREHKLPEGVELCATYMTNTQTGYCVWKAYCKETLEKVFDQTPTMKKGTEIIPVIQSYPPTIEYILSLYQQMVQAASE